MKKDLAELAIPAFAYLPLCRSVDPWRHVLRCLPTECHAFSTKARCPALVLFEVEEATTPPGCDVATFLSIDLHEYTGTWRRLHLTDPRCGPLSALPARLFSPHPISLLRPSRLDAELDSPAGATALRPVVDTRRVLPVWKPQGTGLLKMAPEYARAVNIPLQTVANNEGM